MIVLRNEFGFRLVLKYFEGGERLTFGDALEMAKAGKILRRKGWPDGDVLFCNYTDDMQPFLEVSSGESDPIPYFTGNADLFADDWEVLAG